jgi:NifB/MoaA-like Fe-S oxidoreductase
VQNFYNDYSTDAVNIIYGCSFDLFHINFERTKNSSQGLELPGKVNNEDFSIIAGGSIESAEDVLRVPDRKAGAASITAATVKKPDLVKNIKIKLENKESGRRQ